ncbi:hypothetical protein AB1Y20_015901 [Prymnesium parvum]|uniref:Uncharacterized protein n=1 Tax=Prymnesium parvum TaxID=97485 RepID=A0AB34JZT4_PRYPA
MTPDPPPIVPAVPASLRTTDGLTEPSIPSLNPRVASALAFVASIRAAAPAAPVVARTVAIASYPTRDLTRDVTSTWSPAQRLYAPTTLATSGLPLTTVASGGLAVRRLHSPARSGDLPPPLVFSLATRARA